MTRSVASRGTGYTVPNPNRIKRPDCLSWTVLPVPVYHSRGERTLLALWEGKNEVWQVSRTCQTWQECYVAGAGVAGVAAGAGFALFLLLLFL